MLLTTGVAAFVEVHHDAVAGPVQKRFSLRFEDRGEVRLARELVAQQVFFMFHVGCVINGDTCRPTQHEKVLQFVNRVVIDVQVECRVHDGWEWMGMDGDGWMDDYD